MSYKSVLRLWNSDRKTNSHILPERRRKDLRLVHQHYKQVQKTPWRGISCPAIDTESTRATGRTDEDTDWIGGFSEETCRSNPTVCELKFPKVNLNSNCNNYK